MPLDQTIIISTQGIAKAVTNYMESGSLCVSTLAGSNGLQKQILSMLAAAGAPVCNFKLGCVVSGHPWYRMFLC